MTSTDTHHRHRHESRHRRGAAAVECAVLMPLLITLFLGCTDFARAIHAHIALSNAARVGADYGATHQFTDETQADWENTISDRILEEAATIPGFSPAELTVEIDSDPENPAGSLVFVTCRYNFTTAVSWPALPSEILLRQRVVMCQYQ